MSKSIAKDPKAGWCVCHLIDVYNAMQARIDRANAEAAKLAARCTDMEKSLKALGVKVPQ